MGKFELRLDNRDCCTNLVDLRVLQRTYWRATVCLAPASTAEQTVRYVEGDIDEFVERNNELFGTDALYGQSWREGQSE